MAVYGPDQVLIKYRLSCYMCPVIRTVEVILKEKEKTNHEGGFEQTCRG